MELRLQTKDELDAAENGYMLTPTGIKFLRDLSEKESVECCRRIARHDTASRWQMGDWLVHIKQTDVFKRRNGESGSLYAYPELLTGLSRETLSRRMRVAEAFPPDSPSRNHVGWAMHELALRIVPELRGDVLKEFARQKFTYLEAVEHVDKIEAVKLRTTHRPEPKGKSKSGYVANEVICPNIITCQKCGHKNPCKAKFKIHGNKAPKGN